MILTKIKLKIKLNFQMLNYYMIERINSMTLNKIKNGKIEIILKV
jgi:hypothetical protein